MIKLINIIVVILLAGPGFYAQVPDYKNPNLTVEKRLEDLMSQMTLKEKIQQLRSVDGDFFWNWTIKDKSEAKKIISQYIFDGVGLISKPNRMTKTPRQFAEYNNMMQKLYCEKSRLGIPVFINDEGLHGFCADSATSFPSPLGMASSWNTGLVNKVFTIVGKEARLSGVTLLHAPNLDLARDHRFGRCEETYGEDPYLTGEMGLAGVRGLQGATPPFIDKYHVGATLKHFVGFGSPEGGQNSAPAKEDERTIYDICMYPFKIGIQKGRAMSLMASYNEVNGVPMHNNKKYLTGILREEWEFDGIVVSDWYANLFSIDHGVAKDFPDAGLKAILAGIDLENPTLLPSFGKLDSFVNIGILDSGYIDRSVRRILKMKFEMGLFENPYTNPDEANNYVGNSENRKTALEIANESIILLKNNSNILPLQKDKYKTIAVIGPHANFCEIGNYSGVPKQRITILDGIKKKVGNEINVLYSEGIKITKDIKTIEPDTVYLEDKEANLKRIANALVIANKSDIIILCIGGNALTTREAYSPTHKGDNSDLNLRSEQNTLLEELYKTGKPIIVCLVNGSPMTIKNISENSDALLECWYLGQEGGDALANVIFGDVNPSGKLPVSLAYSVGQMPIYYNHKPSAQFVGYMFEEMRPLYPFGFGLSYTTFKYDSLKIEPYNNSNDTIAAVFIDVTNSGNIAGKEIVQLYIHDILASVTRPVKELKDFAKIDLKQGETKTVKFYITPEKLAFHDIDMNYVVEPGDFKIMVGPSSEDLQKVSLNVNKKIEVK